MSTLLHLVIFSYFLFKAQFSKRNVMYHSFLIHSSTDGHLGCFHVLAMINSAAMNIGVHVSLSDLVSLGVYAQKWDCWIIWKFYFQFFKKSPHWENSISKWYLQKFYLFWKDFFVYVCVCVCAFFSLNGLARNESVMHFFKCKEWDMESWSDFPIVITR